MNDRKLITWIDVERKIKEKSHNKTTFPQSIIAIFCFSTGMDVEFYENIHEANDWLNKIFDKSFIQGQNAHIKLDLNNEEYPINFIDSKPGNDIKKVVYPLWKEQIYKPDIDEKLPSEWSGDTNVIAFHSFKGGVGRTTALMTYAAAILDAGERSKVLLVDADLEAPGISFWLDNESTPTVSFINFIEAIHYSSADANGVTDYFASELRKTSINIDGPNKEVFVLTSALDFRSIMDMSVTPEHLSKNLENPWILSDYLKLLGEKLNVDVVLIDLRAGLSELSSPLIFDHRIEHYFVTTVAPQSIKGMCEVLSRVYDSHQKLPNDSREKVKPSVIVSLLTSQLKKLPVYSKATELLNEAYPSNDSEILEQGIEWLEADFNETLMSLSSIKNALEVLPSSTLFKAASSWACSLYSFKHKEIFQENFNLANENNDRAQRLYDTCYKFQFAENANTKDMLITDPLRNLAKNYTDSLPNAVSIGAKGAGKTFTFLQVCMTGSWKDFLKIINKEVEPSVDASIFPWIASTNLAENVGEIVRKTRADCLSELGINSTSNLTQARQKITAALDHPDTNWDIFWINFLLAELGNNCQSLEELNDWLSNKNKSLLLLVDGIEDIFDSPEKNDSQKEAIKALLQLPNALSEISNRKIGIISFIRADYVQTVIKQNVSQYISRYQSFRLEWTPESFLRLVYWICGKSSIIDAKSEEAEKLNIDHLLKELERLWGKKLGRDNSKEASTARWVFAALCDLNGKLQARDIVRFLKFSADVMLKAQTNGIKPELWPDRVLAPESIRRSLPPCSEEKVTEAANEIKTLYDWRTSLESISPDVKKVPFNPLEVGLDLVLLNSLKELGIIYEDTDQISEDRYFLPEIYRWGLKFTSMGGGRPRVQALLKRNLGGLPF